MNDEKEGWFKEVKINCDIQYRASLLFIVHLFKTSVPLCLLCGESGLIRLDEIWVGATLVVALFGQAQDLPLRSNYSVVHKPDVVSVVLKPSVL